MSTIIQGYQLRTLLMGDQVIKGPAVVPTSSETTLYTVSGGRIYVTSLVGIVTTVFTSTATTLTMGPKPTTGTANADGIHDATILTSAALGAWIIPALTSGVAGAGLVVDGLAWINEGNSGFMMDQGTIEYEASAANTGQIEWYLSYVPLDTGAYVS